MDISQKANNTHDTIHRPCKKRKDQSVDASVLLRRGTKIIMGGRGRERPGRVREGGGREGAGSGMGRDRKLNRNMRQ